MHLRNLGSCATGNNEVPQFTPEVLANTLPLGGTTYRERKRMSDAFQTKLKAERLEREAATGAGRVDLVK